MELAKQKEAIRVDTHTYNPQRASRVYPVYFYKIILKRWGLNSIPSPPIFIYIYISQMNLSIIVQQAWRCVISLNVNFTFS